MSLSLPIAGSDLDLSPEALQELKRDWEEWSPVPNDVADKIMQELYKFGLVEISPRTPDYLLLYQRKIYQKTKAGLAYSNLTKS